jgi:AraC-like DNA-binding protein
MKTSMNKKQIRQFIKEQIEEVSLEESIIDFVFGIASSVAGALIDKHRDYLLSNLKDDPEIKRMQRDVGASRDAMVRAFTNRYQSNKGFQNKVNTLIKKVR